MNDAPEELARQAAWQKARRDLPWPEKVRMVLVMRDSITALRKTWRSPSGPADTAGTIEPEAPASPTSRA